MKSLLLFFFDVDNFKNINDQLGHQTGDEILRSIGRTLKGSSKEDETREKGTMRQTDVAARLGGDEFMLLMSINKNYVEKVLNKIHNELTQITYNDTEGNPHKIEISMGARIMTPDNLTNQENEVWSFEEIHKKTDEAMFLAKRNGKNRVEILNINQEIPTETKDKEWYVGIELQKHKRELDEFDQNCPNLTEQARVAYSAVGSLKYHCKNNTSC